MGIKEAVLLLGAGAALLAGLLLAARSARTMRRLETMLRRAMDGEWKESVWDESRLSRLEAQFSRFLTSSALSRKRLDEEQAKIKGLVSDIAHQTKTPVANILLYTELLGEKELDDDSRDLLREIARQGEKLRFLTEALVKTSRLESGLVQVHPAPRPVRPMLEELAAAFGPKARDKGVALSLAGGGDFTAVFDEKWTAEAIGNLIDNAIKYTPPGPGARIRIEARPFALFCCITVSDTGIGLSEDERARVFERFYRAPAAAGAPGVGLGLYLARQIISLQGGYLRLDSRKGQGTAVSVFLPQER